MDVQQIKSVEIQDIFIAGEADYIGKYPLRKQQRKAIYSIINCRGPHMGRHMDKCDHCGHYEISYNSCRNRHCPKCQLNKQNNWTEQLKNCLPQVRYFHIVFTLPQELNNIIYRHQRLCYAMLFKASSQKYLIY